jgi:lipopolysaccharide transport system ATP-binding protein
MKPAIRIRNLSKSYRLGARREREYHTLREALVKAAVAPWHRLRRLASRAPAPATDAAPLHRVLDDVSFDVQPGEVVGLLGRNGVGKSTLLKVLSRITEPTSGRVELRGRVGSLLEVGVGFHSELTGRENIFLNGAILGMSNREIARKFDEIVAFAEIDEFLDTPAKRYSSGMFMRLAFAVAAHLDPEILLVDEVLAVGDAAFQKKCLGKMREVGRSGRTIVFVSHNMAAVTNLCTRAVLLVDGRVAADGDPQQVAEQYLAAQADGDRADYDLAQSPLRRAGRTPVLRRLQLRNGQEQATSRIPCGGAVLLDFALDFPRPVQAPQLRVDVDNGWGQRVCSVATHLSATALPALEGPCRVRCTVPELALVPGTYTLSLSVGVLHEKPLDQLEQAVTVEVLPHDFYGSGRMPTHGIGQFLVRSQWSVNNTH